MNIKHQSRVKSQNGDGLSTMIVYQGGQGEMLELQNAHPIDEGGEFGRLKSSRVYQDSPKIWCCELLYESSGGGEYSSPPGKGYGKKSAQLKGSMLSMPLESHPDYRTCWNYYLAGSPGTSEVPEWWETAENTVISEAEAQKFRWVRSPGECPCDKKGMWHTLKDPVKPGVSSYDAATYSITESARFGTAKAAGRMIANTLNKIGMPNETFGITGGNWKCDDAGVSWSGKYWVATMTWTRSGNDEGWDKDLYEN